jgi:WD40 repeat protein
MSDEPMNCEAGNDPEEISVERVEEEVDNSESNLKTDIITFAEEVANSKDSLANSESCLKASTSPAQFENVEVRVEEVENSEKKIEEETTEENDQTAAPIETFSESINFIKLNPAFRPNLLGQVSFESYTRGCKWSPDGLCILSLTDDNRLKIFDTPSYQTSKQTTYQTLCQTSESDELHPAVTMKEAETVYDFQWFPLMDSSKPETSCLATTSQSQPIHLYDAFDGHIRATYR